MIDNAVIKVKPGDGGDGLASFRKEKYVPRGGPWGGDGGVGGDIIVSVNPNLNTLNNFHRQRMYKAVNGQPGMKKLMKGKDGESLEIKVPLGTLIYDENNTLIKDFTEPEQGFILFKGGRGGLGNNHFKSSVHQAPMTATAGEKHDFMVIHLELKLLADVGIIGLPSAGKSTLINSLTKTNAKTADYPFTTLEPNLGVLNVDEYINGADRTLVLADIPGLIEGASEGKGLGSAFLKHIERARILIHLIDGSDLAGHADNIEEHAIESYNTIQNELKKWHESLVSKPQLIAINKCDLSEVEQSRPKIEHAFKEINKEVVFISAASKTGLRELVEKTLKLSDEAKKKQSEEAPPAAEPKRYTPENLPNRRIVLSNREIAHGPHGDAPAIEPEYSK